MKKKYEDFFKKSGRKIGRGLVSFGKTAKVISKDIKHPGGIIKRKKVVKRIPKKKKKIIIYIRQDIKKKKKKKIPREPDFFDFGF